MLTKVPSIQKRRRATVLVLGHMLAQGLAMKQDSILYRNISSHLQHILADTTPTLNILKRI
jgi:hypothetical protein